MGTVQRLKFAAETPKLSEAVEAFLNTLVNRGTKRNYSGTLQLMVGQLGGGISVDSLDEPPTTALLCYWFRERWGSSAAATYNRNLDALRSATSYWISQGWLAADPSRSLRRRTRPPDRTKALSRAEVEKLLTDDGTALRERALWRMLYETAARTNEILSLDVQDLDLKNRRAKVRRKGGAVDFVVWRTGTARLLPRLLGGRKVGPVFLTERRARVPLASADVDGESGKGRLSYRRAAELFEAATDGGNLHQLRHSALTHAAEDGANTSTLLAFSGHTSVASLARYARVSPEALGRWQQQRDPVTRKH